MNIKGQGHSLTLVQGHSDSTFSNETAELNKAKFHVETPWDGGDESEYKWFMSHDQEGRHAHIW